MNASMISVLAQFLIEGRILSEAASRDDRRRIRSSMQLEDGNTGNISIMWSSIFQEVSFIKTANRNYENYSVPGFD